MLLRKYAVTQNPHIHVNLMPFNDKSNNTHVLVKKKPVYVVTEKIFHILRRLA